MHVLSYIPPLPSTKPKTEIKSKSNIDPVQYNNLFYWTSIRSQRGQVGGGGRLGGKVVGSLEVEEVRVVERSNWEDVQLF